MGKHLVFEGSELRDYGHKMYEVTTLEYIKRRLQFWKWYKHETMVRPILRLRKGK